VTKDHESERVEGGTFPHPSFWIALFLSQKRLVGNRQTKNEKVQGSNPCTFEKMKKINVLVKECFRAVLLKPVEGMRDRWAG
jgi:hypothetical protein